MLIVLSSQLDAHRKRFTVSINPVVNSNVPELNLDIPRTTTFPITQGTYRLVTNAGKTNKYVTFPVDGAIRQNWTNYTCFYTKNNEDSYDKLGCVDTTKILDKDFHINLG